VEGFDTGAAIKLAERLRASVASSPLRWTQRDVPVTVSVGVVPISAQSGTGFDVLRRAEDACSVAKESGRNQVCEFEGHMQRGPNLGEDEIWVQRVRRGLKRNLFHLTTQWVECAPAHRREGDVFETLIALEDEEGFWATALQFLPAAERHALASELDTWTLLRTLEVLDGQREDMDRLAFCGINLSSQSATQPEWLDSLVEALQRYPRVPPSKLCFELRQDVFLQDINQAARFCDTLRALGCRVAVDHFIGRRTDDLALLRRIPADFIKVDARHFPHVATDGAERLVAEGVIKLAHTLKRRVMVSHIESEDSLKVWRNLEANYFQGFAVSRPSPVVFARP
jgi:EAL domain-containing protein (putative c-di-GMP-specific phosphodiesterase class I)